MQAGWIWGSGSSFLTAAAYLAVYENYILLGDCTEDG
ncbi:unnamed protein product, partial [marine sediment metagenome]